MDHRGHISTCKDQLVSRQLDGGGFPNRPAERFRPDATAWAILALTASGDAQGIVERARNRLADFQLPDGRVGITNEHPEAYWPTPLAALAWHGSPEHEAAQRLALEFMLSTSGRQFASDPESPLSHDTSIRGWSWISETHSMVEPTALSVLALRASGYEDHDRTREAIRMLLDRQLPSGGWNYGNTLVYGQELYPQSDSTGIALSALAGAVPERVVSKSLAYLNDVVPKIRTPHSLGWTLLGLCSWGIRPPNNRSWILESLKRQQTYGDYDTANLSILLLAFSSKVQFPWEIARTPTHLPARGNRA